MRLILEALEGRASEKISKFFSLRLKESNKQKNVNKTTLSYALITAFGNALHLKDDVDTVEAPWIAFVESTDHVGPFNTTTDLMMRTCKS